MENQKYDSVYEIKKAQIKAVGGDDTLPYDSVYSAELELLRLLKEGGGGGLSAPFYTETILPETPFDPTWYKMGIKTTDDEFVGSYLWADTDNNYGIDLGSLNTAATMSARQDAADFRLNTQVSNVSMFASTNGSFNISAEGLIDDTGYIFQVSTEQIWYGYNNPSGQKYVHIYPDKIDFEYWNFESGDMLTYTLDGTTIDKANNALTKTLADTYYNPINSVTASTSGYKFPKWNNKGQITGTIATAYQASQKINDTSRTIYSTSSSALPDIYAPTTAGTNGQYLRSNGSGAPTWANISIDPHIIDDADAITGTYTPAMSAFYSECISKGYQASTYIKIVSYDAEGTAAESYYLPSSSRIYNGNVELWLFTTEDGNTWENIHYLITGESITRNVTNGTFGA